MKGTEEKTIKKRDNGNKKGQADGDDQEKEVTEIHDLKDLPKKWNSESEPKLELPNPSSIAPAEMSKQIEKIDRDQKKLREWAIGLLGNIDQRTEEVNKEKDPQRKKIAQRLSSAGNGEDQAALESYLRGEKDPFYKQTAWTAVFEYYLTKPHQSQAEVQTTIKKMIGEKYLAEDPTGQLKAYGKAYGTDPALGEEIETVRKYLNDLISNVLEIEKKSLFTRATLTPAEFLAGKTGMIALTIHAEETQGKDGQKFWRRGGVLLIESDGKRIWPVTASGGIEKTVKEGIDMKVSLYLDSLSRNTAPLIRDIPDEKIKKIHSLWYIVRRGLLRHKFAAKATINKREFFIEKKPGICYLDYNGTWDVPNGPRLANFFFLISREEKEGIKRIHLMDIPDHLKDFFAPCMGDYSEERVKFEDVPQPLRAVLQAGYGQTQESEQKSAQIIA